MTTIFDFRPSLHRMIWESWHQAKGLRWFDAAGYAIKGYPTCYICGRQKDFVFDFVKLIPYFDMSRADNKLVYICDDHGRITDYDCTTGESLLLPLPKPYWYRRMRNAVQWLILSAVIPARFIWFFVNSVFMWHIIIWFYWYARKLKQ